MRRVSGFAVRPAVTAILFGLGVGVAFVTETVRAQDPGIRRIPNPALNQYLVYTSDPRPIQAVANELAGRYGGRVRYIYHVGSPPLGFVVDMPEASAIAMSREPGVGVWEYGRDCPPFDDACFGLSTHFASGGGTAGEPFGFGIIVKVLPGVNPLSTGIRVSVDLSAFGGPREYSLVDTPGDGDPYFFEGGGGLPIHTPPGARIVPIRMTDGQGRLGTAAMFMTVQPATDIDHDGMPDRWEMRFGLNPNSAVGPDGPAADLDGDGRSNLEEYQADTHPRAFFTRYFAEGVSTRTPFFSTYFRLLNLHETEPATALVRFVKGNGDHRSGFVSVPPGLPRAISNSLWEVDSEDFAALVESNVPLIAERETSWGTGANRGAHTETAVNEPAVTWHLAEGATHSGFDLFYLIYNPGAAAASVQVKYLLPSRQPVFRTYAVGAHSRATIWVDQDPELTSTDVSAVITSSQPIIVERSMYLSTGTQTFRGGICSAGVTTPAQTWFFAEGATGDFFDAFILLANPTPVDADVAATFHLPNGDPVVKSYRVAAESRLTVWVDREDPRLAATAFSLTVVSTNGVPIVAERSMWWPGPTSATWHEGHNSAGSTVSGTRWAIPDVETRSFSATETYLLIANVSTQPTTVRVRLVPGTGSPVERMFELSPQRRLTLNTKTDLPSLPPQVFGPAAIVESLGPAPAPLIVERSTYIIHFGAQRIWAAGTNAPATRLQ